MTQTDAADLPQFAVRSISTPSERLARATALTLALALALALAPACIQWVPSDANRPSCQNLGCRACASHVECAWCPSSRACVSLQSAGACMGDTHIQPALCAPEDDAPRDAQIPRDADDASADGDAQPPLCDDPACEPCAERAACAWDDADSVCRARGAEPAGRPVITSRAACPPSPSVRIVNAIADATAVSVCYARAASGPFSSLFALFPGARPPFPITRGMRTQPLSPGSAGSYVFRFVADGQQCTSTRTLAPDLPVTLRAGEVRWIALFDERAGTRRAISFASVRTTNADRLSLRWLVARADTGATSFEYDASTSSTTTWTATGSGAFARNATTTTDGYSLMPAGALASRARARIDAITVSSDQALPATVGAFTLILATAPSQSGLPGIFLALDEADERTASSVL